MDERGFEGDAAIEEIQYRGQFHDQVRNDLAYFLKSQGAVVEMEVPVTLLAQTPATAVIDIMVKNPDTGRLYGVEVKTGQDPPFTPNQQIVYPHLDTEG